jgi:putative ABC transport system ATP-binding protein
MQLLTELNGEGTTVVMVTHSHSHAEYAHRIVNLLDGALVTESIRRVL